MNIYIPCQGGLGNQLFIWAAAHRISTAFNCTLTITYLDNKKNIENRELFPLIKFCEHNIKISNSAKFGKILNLHDIIQFRMPQLKSSLVINDYKNPHDAPSKFHHKPLITRGYFQNNDLVETVFNQIYPELRAHLSMQSRTIEMQPHVAVHVRRGDYLKSAEFYGVLTKRYYDKILSREDNYVLFTENRQQVMDFKNDSNLISIIDQRKADVWQTMAMLVEASKLHMANSTLSWWGAKLSENKKELITMPYPWHNQGHQFQSNLISKKFEIIQSEFEEYGH